MSRQGCKWLSLQRSPREPSSGITFLAFYHPWVPPITEVQPYIPELIYPSILHQHFPSTLTRIHWCAKTGHNIKPPDSCFSCFYYYKSLSSKTTHCLNSRCLDFSHIKKKKKKLWENFKSRFKRVRATRVWNILEQSVRSDKEIQ